MKYYIGIDIGGTSIKAGIVDENGNILVKDAVKTDARQERLAPDAAALAERLLIQAGLKKENITGVGMGIPGTVDAKNGIVRYSNNIAISDLPIAAQFRALFDCPIEIGNDADAAALGELYFGSARECRTSYSSRLVPGSVQASSKTANCLPGVREDTSASVPAGYSVPAADTAVGKPMLPSRH